jgi:hypothetical protein
MDGLRLAGKAADTALFRKATQTSGSSKRALSALTRAADSSKLWIEIAGALEFGGDTGRRTATKGLAAIVAASTLANAPMKRLAPHYPCDVVAGAAVGLSTGLIVHGLTKWSDRSRFTAASIGGEQ